MEYIYGRKPILEALRGSRRVAKVFIAQEVKPSKTISLIIAAAEDECVPIARLPMDKLEGLLGDVLHQGVAAEVKAFKYADIADIVAKTVSKDHALVVLLDGITDPQNLGAVIRTAIAAGADGLFVPKHGTAPITAAVVKASAGIVEHANIIEINLSAGIDKLKKAGYWIVGADAAGSINIWDVDLEGKIGLVLGAEGKGLSRLVRSKCDFLAKLPLSAPVESLNVSAAAAAMIYEIVRQRGTLKEAKA